MSRRIQAYFRNENEAEGAKTALISYNVEMVEVGALTDPLDTGVRGRNILVPLVAYNGSSMTGGLGGAAGTTGGVPGAAGVPGTAFVPGVALTDPINDDDNRLKDGEVRNDTEIADGDLDDLRYVMELKVPRDKYLEVIEALRRKHAFVEVFE
ncbi:MAG: hypothetical protein K6T94_06620 [Paenibacillus sp.]|nr:hypothetical protein [Paenibacillus sp.]